jgi:hypothetical protein
MLTGYDAFNEDSSIAILYRIFRTLGTPTATHLLTYPTLTNERVCPHFSSNYDKFPQWTGMRWEELLPKDVSA